MNGISQVTWWADIYNWKSAKAVYTSAKSMPPYIASPKADQQLTGMLCLIRNRFPVASNISQDRKMPFFSTQKKRISIHAVENLVEKYTKEFIPQKKIPPQAAVYVWYKPVSGNGRYLSGGRCFGHSDVGTTRKHYAALDEGRRRMAASAVKLREP